MGWGEDASGASARSLGRGARWTMAATCSEDARSGGRSAFGWIGGVLPRDERLDRFREHRVVVVIEQGSKLCVALRIEAAPRLYVGGARLDQIQPEL